MGSTAIKPVTSVQKVWENSQRERTGGLVVRRGQLPEVPQEMGVEVLVLAVLAEQYAAAAYWEKSWRLEKVVVLI